MTEHWRMPYGLVSSAVVACLALELWHTTDCLPLGMFRTLCCKEGLGLCLCIASGASGSSVPPVSQPQACLASCLLKLLLMSPVQRQPLLSSPAIGAWARRTPNSLVRRAAMESPVQCCLLSCIAGLPSPVPLKGLWGFGL